jgi:hypothetical protein
MKSEFGKGLCYNLGLFLAHAERWNQPEIKSALGKMWAESWFNSASDHLYELQWQQAPKHLQKRLKKFADICLTFGHGFPEKKATEQDLFWALSEAKELLRLIDKSNKIETAKGDFQ